MTTIQAPSSDQPAEASARTALDRAVALLLSRQHQDGHWDDGPSRGVTAVAQGVLTRDVLGVPRPEQAALAAHVIRSRQRPDGSWAEHRGGPPDEAATLACYLALRAAGEPADAYHLALAAGWLREAGGRCHPDPVTMTWLWLAGLGSWTWWPAIPPEVLFLPGWAARWLPGQVTRPTRLTVPLSVIGSTRRPGSRPPFDLDEIAPALTARRSGLASAELPGLVHGLLGGWQRLAPMPPPLGQVRAVAHRRGARWLRARQERDGSWGRRPAETALALIALHQLGHDASHRAVATGLSWLDRQAGQGTSQAGEGTSQAGEASPTAGWGTALAIRALLAAGLPPGHPALARAGAFVAGHRGARPDRPSAPPASAQAARLAAELAALGAAGQAAGKHARHAGVRLLQIQSADGSWQAGNGDGDPVVTAAVVRALVSAGMKPGRSPIQRAARWLAGPGSVAAPTTMATSAVVLGLIACGDAESLASAGLGVDRLASAQRGDGDWDETPAAIGGGSGTARAAEIGDAGPYLDRLCGAVEALAGYLRLTAGSAVPGGFAAR